MKKIMIIAIILLVAFPAYSQIKNNISILDDGKLVLPIYNGQDSTMRAGDVVKTDTNGVFVGVAGNTKAGFDSTTLDNGWSNTINTDSVGIFALKIRGYTADVDSIVVEGTTITQTVSGSNTYFTTTSRLDTIITKVDVQTRSSQFLWKSIDSLQCLDGDSADVYAYPLQEAIWTTANDTVTRNVLGVVIGDTIPAYSIGSVCVYGEAMTRVNTLVVGSVDVEIEIGMPIYATASGYAKGTSGVTTGNFLGVARAPIDSAAIWHSTTKYESIKNAIMIPVFIGKK
jgi:hypothetical protein